MTDISKITDELINHAGFKIEKNSKTRAYIEEKIASNVEDEGEEFAIDQFCFENVFIGLEGTLADDPYMDDEQSIYTFTSQICGYLTIDSNPFFMNMEEDEWMRINTECTADSLEIVLWDNTCELNGFMISPVLFNSIEEFQKCLNDFRDVKINNLRETPEEERYYIKVFNDFINKYPAVVDSFYGEFQKLGPIAKERAPLVVPETVSSTIDCAKFFTELAFSGGGASPVLLDTFSQPSGFYDVSNSCHVILRLFTLHYLGLHSEAECFAREMALKKDLSPQALKWAKRYTQGHNFFETIGS